MVEKAFVQHLMLEHLKAHPMCSWANIWEIIENNANLEGIAEDNDAKADNLEDVKHSSFKSDSQKQKYIRKYCKKKYLMNATGLPIILFEIPNAKYKERQTGQLATTFVAIKDASISDLILSIQTILQECEKDVNSLMDTMFDNLLFIKMFGNAIGNYGIVKMTKYFVQTVFSKEVLKERLGVKNPLEEFQIDELMNSYCVTELAELEAELVRQCLILQ